MDSMLFNVMAAQGSVQANPVSGQGQDTGVQGAFAGFLNSAVSGNIQVPVQGVAEEAAAGDVTALTFEQKAQMLLDQLDNIDESVIKQLKNILVKMFVSDAQNGKINGMASGMSGNIAGDLLLSGEESTEIADILSSLADVTLSADNDEEALEVIADVFGKIFKTDSKNDKDAENSVAVMLAAMIQTYSDSSYTTQRVSEMAADPQTYSVQDITNYVSDSDISQCLDKFAQAAQACSQEIAQQPEFTILSYKQEAGAGVTAQSAVRVSFSSELNQIIGENELNRNQNSNQDTNGFESMLMQSMNTPQTFIPQEAETVSPAEVFTQVAPQITEKIITQLSQSVQNDGASELKLMLNPESLGEVAVKLVSHEGVISIMISAADPSVAKALSDNLPSLVSSLAGNNVDVKNVQIVEPGDAAAQMGFEFANHNSGFEQNNSSSNSCTSGVFAIDGIADDEAAVESTSEILPKGEGRLWATA